MKKIFFPLMLILAVVLTACSSSSISTPVGSTGTDLPIETQLAVGTLKLSGTDQDITINQAKDLVLYWEVYKKLSQSEMAAQAEIDGLTAQIQETMTDDQMQAITDMNLNQQDVITAMQGVTLASNTAGDSTISIPSGSGSGAGMPAGGPPGDGGGAPPDGGMPSDIGGGAQASGTDQSQSSQASSGSTVIAEVPTALVEAVIQTLQQKIAA